MKNITKAIIATITLTTTAFAYAASPQMITREDARTLQKVGVVSASGFTTLDDLVASLNMKAADAGASHYRITSTTGHNLLSGTATLYR
jgi:Protein of unknown function (DUF1471).